MRAFAVLMMVQGHTVDSLLGEEFRTFDSPFYAVWHTFRGFTAPIFMFTSGVVFTYLLRLNKLPFKENPRVKKGFKRFLLLLGIGYLLRYPTYKIFDFSNVSDEGWKIFYAVDALHLIGFGLLVIVILVYIAEKAKQSDFRIFLTGSLFFVLLYPLVKSVDWASIFPLPIAGYFYRDTGSLFPLFPWAGYVISGGILGSYLARNPEVFLSKKFGYRLLIIGASFISLSVLVDGLSGFVQSETSWSYSISVVFYRVGVVLVMNSVMSMIAVRVGGIPALIKQIGRNTLPIYVIHLIILYGCAWIPGMYKFYSRSFSLELTLGFAAFMIILMVSMVIMIEKVKEVRKSKMSTAAA